MKVIATSLLIALFVQSYICFGSATAQEIDYMDEDLFDELESSEVQSDGDAILSTGAETTAEQDPLDADSELPKIREVFPGLTMGKLVNMSRKFTPRDYISKRTWFSTVLHVNSTRVVANDFNGKVATFNEQYWSYFKDVVVPLVQDRAPKGGLDDLDSAFYEWQLRAQEEDSPGQARTDTTGFISPKFKSMNGGKERKQMPALFADALQLYIAQFGMHAPDDVAKDWVERLTPICERLHIGVADRLEQRAMAPTGIAIVMYVSAGMPPKGGEEAVPRLSIVDPRGQLPPFGHTLRIRLKPGSLVVHPAFMVHQLSGILATEESPAWVCRSILPESSVGEEIGVSDFADLSTTVRKVNSIRSS